MTPLKYPLEQLLEIKNKRFDQAVKVLEEKKAALAREEEKLRVVTKERDEVKQHRKDKLQQLREGLDSGLAFVKVQQMKVYLKVVDEKVAEKEKKVRDQKVQVDNATKQVELATKEMYQRKKDVEKIEMHRKEWEKEVAYLIEQKAGHEQDDQGSATHTMKKRERKV